MAAAVEASRYRWLEKSYGIPPVRAIEDDFLASGWSFVHCADGKAYWIKGDRCIPSERNR